MLRLKPFNKKFSFTIEYQFEIYKSFDEDVGDINQLLISIMHFNYLNKCCMRLLNINYKL